MRQFFTFCFIILVSAYAASAQAVVTESESADIKHEAVTEQMYKLKAGESISLSPNPVSSANPVMQVTAINVDIYSYHVYTSEGQIVEIENLSGRPNPTYIMLQSGIHAGVYVVKFDTDSGIVTRKFQVF